jgi:hypothetical protein
MRESAAKFAFTRTNVLLNLPLVFAPTTATPHLDPQLLADRDGRLHA